jgi:hypothetical protein
LEEFFTRTFNDLAARPYGLLSFRLYIQTAVAAVLAIRAGLLDAREGNPPYIWALAFNPEHRHELLKEGWKDISKLFAMAFVLDVVYQAIVLNRIHPGQAVAVAIVLAVVPYVLLRAPITRLFGKKNPPP